MIEASLTFFICMSVILLVHVTLDAGRGYYENHTNTTNSNVQTRQAKAGKMRITTIL